MGGRVRAPRPCGRQPDDRLYAGSGNDSFVAGRRELTRPSQGEIDCVRGDGTAYNGSYASTKRSVNATLGDDLDDGRAGENENVRADVEIIEGSPFADTITGSDADKRERYIGAPATTRSPAWAGPKPWVHLQITHDM